MKRIFNAVTMAAAALATLGLAGPSVVSAGASSQAVAGQVRNASAWGRAGYNMTGGGWRFRYLETTLTVPASTTRATSAGIELWSDWDAVHLAVKAGGGPDSIGYGISYWDTDKTLAVQPSAGDQVTISIYEDRSARKDYFTAVDLSTGAKATAVEPFYPYVFKAATVMGGGPKWSLASSATRLWAFKDTRLTTYNGTHGAILGPWTTYRIFGTRGGTPTGKVVLSPSYPWNNGHNFGIWWRAAN
jgi:hypothetical protein